MNLEEYKKLIQEKEEELERLKSEYHSFSENCVYNAGEIVLVTGRASINPYSIQLITEVNFNRYGQNKIDYSVTAVVPYLDSTNTIRLSANIANAYAIGDISDYSHP